MPISVPVPTLTLFTLFSDTSDNWFTVTFITCYKDNILRISILKVHSETGHYLQNWWQRDQENPDSI